MFQTVQAFQLGDKLEIAFPKGFGIIPSQKFKVKKENQGIILIPII